MAALPVQIAKSLVNGYPPRKRRKIEEAVAAGYDSTKDSVEYAWRVYNHHAPFTGTRGTVLEIGPGGNVATAALFLKHGAEKAVCIDSTPWIADAKDPLYCELGVADLLERIEYMAPASVESADLPVAAFDVIYSQATLEHVRDPGLAVTNIARWLRSGGKTSHQIDLRDHRDFDHPLRFLTHSRLTWRLLSVGQLMPPNRWRLPDWLTAFERSGLTVTNVDPDICTDVTDADRARLARRFRNLPADELAVVSVRIVAVKV